MVRLLSILCFVAVLAPACGDGPSNADETSPLVSAAAQWQCDRQRFAFDSLEDLDTLREHTIAAAGVSAEEFAAFESLLEADADLREEVFEVYDRDCLGG